MSAVDQVLAIAKAEIGYLEKASNSSLDSKTANAGSKNYTKYARDLDDLGAFSNKVNGYAWCASFVAWCFCQAFGLTKWSKMTGIPIGGNGASCTSCVSYYKKARRFHTSSPQIGDQIFFKTTNGSAYAHTGLVYKVSGSRVYTYEGNTSGASGVVANGGGVVAKDYALSYSRIGGYGRPDYTAAASTGVTNVCYQAKVTATSLNCRKSYTTASSIVTTYILGDILTITQECNGFGFTGSGWVSLQYVSKLEDDTMTSTEIINALKADPNFGSLVLSALTSQLNQGTLSTKIQSELFEAVKLGITDGSNPTQYVTRAQAAVMVKRGCEKAVNA